MKNIAELLYLSKAVIFNAKYVNGFVAPIYIDVRNTISSVHVRQVITEEMKKELLECFPECDLIAGVSTAGIPYASTISYELKLPMCYVRPTEKDHGLGKKIEGKIERNQKIVVVEDVVGSGTSALNAVLALQEAETEVVGIISVFTYDMSISRQNFRKINIKHKSLTDYYELINLGLEKGVIDKVKYDKLLYYRDNIPDIAWKI